MDDCMSSKGTWVKDENIFFSDHHLSHAASAFFPSPFEEAIVLTADGVGEWATTTVAIGKAGAKNAAYLAAQILATSESELQEKLKDERKKNGAKSLRALLYDGSTSGRLLDRGLMGEGLVRVRVGGAGRFLDWSILS